MIAGLPIARNSLLAAAGLDLAIGRNATVGISYVGQIANNIQDYAAKGKVLLEVLRRQFGIVDPRINCAAVLR